MKNLKSQKLYIQVYEEIQNYIRDNNLKAGDKLPTEMEMCERMGVSRNVLREAIKALEITGVVASTPGVGIVIREFNSNFFMSALVSHVDMTNNEKIKECIEELRRVLELGFMDRAFDTIRDADIAVLEEQIEKMREAYETEGKTTERLGLETAKADAKFHVTLYQNVGNPLLLSIIDFFWAYDTYYMRKVSKDSFHVTIDKHQRIVDALKQRDYPAFKEAMDYHFSHDYPKK